MDRYFRLRIPFGTKSYIRNKNEGLNIVGNAYFIFDKNKNMFVDEYLEIIKGNYRITDLALIKPTDHYKNPLFRNFRDNYLDKYSKTNARDILSITHKNLTQDQIIEINNVFKNMNTTIKNMFSCLSGSNISGSETNKKASPMRCIDNEYWDCNFANVVKHFMVNKNEKIKIHNEEIKTYKLIDVMNNNLIPNFNNVFYQYNDELEYKENLDYVEIPSDLSIDYEIQKINHSFKLKEKQEDFIYSIVNETIDDYESFIKTNKLKNRLRSYFVANIRYSIKNKLIPLHSTTKKGNLSLYQNAHIIQFSESIKKITFNDLYDAINPFNCLRIEANIHNIFDKKEIDFDSNGNIIDKQKKILVENYLDMKNMPEQTSLYFKRYLKNIHK